MAAGSTYRPLAGQLAHHIAPPSSVLHTLSLSGSGELPPLLQSHDDNGQSAERCCHHASIGTALHCLFTTSSRIAPEGTSNAGTQGEPTDQLRPEAVVQGLTRFTSASVPSWRSARWNRSQFMRRKQGMAAHQRSTPYAT